MRFNRKSVDMTDGPLFKNIIIYTIPIILTGVLQLLFNAADLAIIGRYCGEYPLDALGSTGSLINLIVTLFMGLSVGVGVVVAQGLGAKDDNTVRKTVHTAVPAALVGGVVLTIIGILGAKLFLTWMKTPEEVLELAALYMRIYFAGIIPILVFNFGAAILRAAGDTKSPLIYLSSAGALNVVLNLIFVLLLGMDVDGVALATTITQTIAAIFVIRALIKRTDSCRLSLKELKFHKNELLKIVRIGLPAGIQGTIFSISNVIIQSSINGFGPVVLPGNTAAANIEGFVYISMNAFHQTAMNFIGQNVGAKKPERINKILVYCLLLVAGTGFVLGVSAFIFARPLLSIYVSDSATAISYGITRMSYISALYFTCGMMDVMTGAIRGMGSSVAPMIVTIIGVCGVRITWIYTVFQSPRFHTLETLYMSYPISWIATLLVQIIFFIVIKRRLEKRIKEKSGLICA
ncbi:MAG: MATE family efflux transporter [Eubacteriales bacterium]|nr:MATE family efflux transporter [Eubacteriales bacterium]